MRIPFVRTAAAVAVAVTIAVILPLVSTDQSPAQHQQQTTQTKAEPEAATEPAADVPKKSAPRKNAVDVPRKTVTAVAEFPTEKIKTEQTPKTSHEKAKQNVAPQLNPRRNLYVKIYQKMRHAVVSVKVRRPGYSKDTTGTGLIVDERGIIVTNRHVVGGSKEVRVELFDGFKVAGQVVAREPNKDLAIVYIKTNKKLTAATLAPTKDMMVGEDVMAIGHPYGYSNTVTRGGISALNRAITLPNGVELKGLIQHDASINPGNSGGPLVNMNGEVIGINVALREDAQGIAFAINADTVKSVLRKHLSAKRLAGVYIGMNFNEAILGETGDRQRVVVSAYEWKDHPVLQKGDHILEIGAIKIRNAFDLERSLWSARPNEEVAVRICRDDHELVVQLPLYESESRPQFVQLPSPVYRGLTSPIRSVATK